MYRYRSSYETEFVGPEVYLKFGRRFQSISISEIANDPVYASVGELWLLSMKAQGVRAVSVLRWCIDNGLIEKDAIAISLGLERRAYQPSVMSTPSYPSDVAESYAPAVSDAAESHVPDASYDPNYGR
jgi:hypothetical protein